MAENKNLTAYDPKYPTYVIPKASPKVQLVPPKLINLLKMKITYSRNLASFV